MVHVTKEADAGGCTCGSAKGENSKKTGLEVLCEVEGGCASGMCCRAIFPD